MWAATTVAIVLGSGPAVPGLSGQETPVPANDSEPRVGFVAGSTWSQQVWDPSVLTRDRGGFVAGAFLEVPFPGGLLGVRAGAQWTQRGGFIDEGPQGEAVTGEIRTDYLAFPIHLLLSGAIGPLRVRAFAGPTLENLLSSKEDAVLGQFLDEQNATVLSGAFGAGVAFPVGGGARIEVEGRWSEGLTNAYGAPFTRIRNRSREALVRFSVPLSRLQGGSP